MTAPTDCDPLWTDDEIEHLTHLGAELLHDPPTRDTATYSASSLDGRSAP
ncbi:hypothetical protein [Streptomyces canus]